MAWYRTGTVAVTNGSKNVVGTGTAWVNNTQPGDALIGPDGAYYEVDVVGGNGAITLVENYAGSTTSGASYKIIPTQGRVRDLAAQVLQLITDYGSVLTGAGAGRFGDGTVSTPGISFASEPDCGLYRIGTNSFGAATGGALRTVWDSDGNFGVGTTLPGAKLESSALSSGATVEVLRLSNAGTGANTKAQINFRAASTNYAQITGGYGASTPNLDFAVAASGDHTFTNNGAVVAKIDSSGNAGFSTTSPQGRLHAVGSGSAPPVIVDTADASHPAYTQYRVNGSAGWEAGMAGIASSYAWRFCYGTLNDANTKLAITNTGFVGFGGNLNGIAGGLQHQVAINYQGGGSTYGLALKSAINSTIAVNFVNASDSAVGSITTGATTTAYNTTSDARLKCNIAPALEVGGMIDKVLVRQFDWLADGSHQRYGFVAQELLQVFPEAVHQPDDQGQMLSVDYSKLVPMLVKEIQALRARVEPLEAVAAK